MGLDDAGGGVGAVWAQERDVSTTSHACEGAHKGEVFPIMGRTRTNEA